MDNDEKNFVAQLLKNNGLDDVDHNVQDLLIVLQERTLGSEVATAISQREQGHFDQSVTAFTKVNRDYFLSIRALQSLLDNIHGVPHTQVILEKYRQFYPFQMGLTHGEGVIELLNRFEQGGRCAIEELVTELHKQEGLLIPLEEELLFYNTRLKGRIAEDEIQSLAHTVETTTRKIFELKTALISCICRVIQENYHQVSAAEKMVLLKHLYVLLSSSIQALDAKYVDVDHKP